MMTAASHVKLVARLLLVVGMFSLLVGLLAGAALGRDVATDGSLRQWAFGPTLVATGIVSVFAWRRNVHLENRPLGLLALLVVGAVGITYFKPINPHTVLMLYGMGVFLSPAGRAAFSGTER